MNIITEDLTYNRTIGSEKTQKIVESDIIVPDSKPDILKLLQSDANVLIPQKEVSDGCIELDGRVDMSIIYTPEAEQDTVKGFSFSLNFNELINNKDISSLDNVFTTTSVEKLDCFMVNSRKLRVKAVISIEYEILRIEPISFATEVSGCDNPQVMRECLTFQNSINICEHLFTILEKIELPSGQESIHEILKNNIKICDIEYQTLNGKVIIKGAAVISILYVSTLGNIECNETELQFTEILDCENITEDCYCDIDFEIVNYKLQLDEDNDGDIRIINVQIDINAYLKSVEDLEIDVISDCFEPNIQTKINSNKFHLEEVIARPTMQTTIRELIVADENVPSVSRVYDIIAKPYITSVKISSGKILCEGHIKTFILYISVDHNAPVYSIHKEIPISYMIDCPQSKDTFSPMLKAEIKHTSYNLNTAGEIELRIVLTLSANVINKREIELITGIEQIDSVQTADGNITIYFVQSGDTLWNIAKRYCVACSEIIKINSLKDENIKPGTKLMIPRV